MTNIHDLIEKVKIQENKNNSLLHMTASEGRMSETARQFLDWRISERYYYGATEEEVMDNGKFTALGLRGVTEFIQEAENAAKDMLGAELVTLYCLSGVHAMMYAILSTTDPGDGVMTIHVQDGGHFATEPIVNIVGRRHLFATFDQKAMQFDIERTAQDFKAQKAKVLYLDMSYYVSPHNLKKLRQALGEEAIIIYDASHTMGLIMGGTFQDPFAEGADVICANTHKTLPGPQKGMVAFKNRELGEKAIAKSNFKLFSNPHIHHLLALSTTILEMREYGEAYAQQIVSNSNELGKSLSSFGYELRMANNQSYSQNHQIHMFIDTLGSSRDTYEQLFKNGIATHFNKVLGGRDFIRFGTQEITRRGMKEQDMTHIASLIHQALEGKDASDEVNRFNNSFDATHYSFDNADM